MRTRRILFVISSQHVKVGGGIGQFLRCLQDWQEELDAYIDVCVDKALTRDQLAFVQGLVIAPKESISYADHRDTFTFNESLNFEMVVNFRNSIMQAFSKNLYTHVVLNTPEANFAVNALGLNTNVVAYTHQESYTLPAPKHRRNPTFSPEFCEMIRYLGGIDIACQSQHISDCIHAFSPNTKTHVIPFLFPKYEVEVPAKQGEGVLFIGRWEERKKPKIFLEVLKETGLKGKVMTNRKGADKFAKAAVEYGVDLDIKFEITGKEKTDFMNSARVAFLPYLIECCPFSVFESMTRMPTVILSDNHWNQSFTDEQVIRTTRRNAAETIQKAHAGEITRELTRYADLNQVAFSAWDRWMIDTEQRTDSSADWDNGIMKMVSDGTQRKSVDIFTKTIYNITSLNQLLTTLKCKDINVRFTDKHTLISTGELTEEAGGLEEFF